MEVVLKVDHSSPTRVESSPDVSKFMSWRDMVVTPLVLVTVLGVAGAATWFVAGLVSMGLFAKTVVFFAVSTTVTMALVRTVAAVFLRRPGVYSRRRHVGTCYAWNLLGFLNNTLLWFETSSSMVPVLLRQPFYNLLGAKIGPGIVAMSGKILDPWFVEIGADATIGEGTLLCGHIMTSSETLMFGRIRIGRGAIVGAHCVVMAGATIGEGALINAMSFVPSNTIVPPHEVWGGNPAQKIRELSPHAQVVRQHALGLRHGER